MALFGVLGVKEDDEEMELQTFSVPIVNDESNSGQFPRYTPLEEVTKPATRAKSIAARTTAPKPSTTVATEGSSPPVAITPTRLPYLPSSKNKIIKKVKDEEAIVGSPPGVHDARRSSFSTKKY